LHALLSLQLERQNSEELVNHPNPRLLDVIKYNLDIIRLVCFLACMLVHGYIPDDFLSSTVLPIPKVVTVTVTVT